jgi:hypothetical protein
MFKGDRQMAVIIWLAALWLTHALGANGLSILILWYGAACAIAEIIDHKGEHTS